MRIVGSCNFHWRALAVLLIALFGASHATTAAAQSETFTPKRPLIFVPGVLGSKLCKTTLEGEPSLVWGTVDTIGNFPSLAIRNDSSDIAPCGLIDEITFLGIFSQQAYGPFVERLKSAGYTEGETLFIFDYDWRLSVFDNAERLAVFVADKVSGDRPVDIVAHSVGGLIARIYALRGGGGRIARLISAGPPWRGAVLTFELLENGWGAANMFMGGLASIRQAILTMPIFFDLMPRYTGCCGGEAPAQAGFESGSADAWTALNWDGITAQSLPDLGEATARQKALNEVVAEPLPDSIEEVLIIGVDQRTPYRYVLDRSGDRAHFDVATSWAGDSIVARDSALFDSDATFSTSFSTHEAILNDVSVQDFVLVTLAKDAQTAIRTVPVRERSPILTAFGDLVQLIGVTISTDQPVHGLGAQARASVHLRPDVKDPVDAGALALRVVLPDGSTMPLALTPDPAASDPTNPFEQSFSAPFNTGGAPGELTLSLTIDNGTGEPRTVTRVLPIVAF